MREAEEDAMDGHQSELHNYQITTKYYSRETSAVSILTILTNTTILEPRSYT